MKESPVQFKWGKLMLLMTLCAMSVSLLAGCEIGNYAAYVVSGNGQKTVKVKAQYDGLRNQSFAVLVAADEYTTFNYPQAIQAIARGVTSNIATSIQGSKPMDPAKLVDFEKANPYWNTVPYDQLIARLKVDRLIVIDIVDFALRQPGNAHIWQGELVAHAGVAEAGSSNGNALDFSTTVKSRYPDTESRVGVLNSDDKTIQLGLVADFSTKTCNLFRDHEEIVK
jgi:hypothetical protein